MTFQKAGVLVVTASEVEISPEVTLSIVRLPLCTMRFADIGR